MVTSMVTPMVAMLRRLVRLPLLAFLLFAGLAIALTIFPRLRGRARDRCMIGWSTLLLRFCGVRVREVVAPGAESLSTQGGGRMLLLNHISWLDIFTIDAVAPASFVAKSEIARWPLAGTLVARVGTVFIERGKRHAVHAVIRQLAARMRDGWRAAVFPEGTTTDGTKLLPFHGNLIEAALESGAPVVPVGLRYVDADGGLSDATNYVGDITFLESLWRITGHPRIVVEVHVLPAIETAGGIKRQDVARRAREAIAGQLGLVLDDAVPENLRRVKAAAA
jgi:1-acyl-sn-glycerol-3-phosphate acyltransferase